MEDQNGKLLSVKRVRDVQTTMRSIWEDLARDKLAPSSWERATATACQRMHDIMHREWPLLRLCNDGWKLEDLATITYPGWKRSYLNSDGMLKDKGADGESSNDDDHDDNNDDNTAKKRKRKASNSNVKSEHKHKVARKRAKGTPISMFSFVLIFYLHPKPLSQTIRYLINWTLSFPKKTCQWLSTLPLEMKTILKNLL